MGREDMPTVASGTRNRVINGFEEITRTSPEKILTFFIKRDKGRNNRGVITSRNRGGGHKRLYRKIDFKRNKYGIKANVASIEYDPNRNARIALLHYLDGEKRYILHPRGLKIGDTIIADFDSPINTGNALPLNKIPLGTTIHNVEFLPGKGGQIARSAGSFAEILAKEGNYVTLRLPSAEIRMISKFCWATIGQVGNIDSSNQVIGKAGSNRWLGRTPKVRGVAKNPCDHPHGGGEGKTPIGRTKPVTPWGKPALGSKTRRPKSNSSKLIIRSRKLG